MNSRHIVLGVLLLLIFGFQTWLGVFVGTLGNATWFIGALIFSFLPWVFEMGKKQPKPPEEMKRMWIFATLFVVVGTFVASFLVPYLGAIFPEGFDASQMTPFILRFWLIIFGGASLLQWFTQKQPIWGLIGIIWLFSAIHFTTSQIVMSNAYLHFALIVGLSFLLAGIMAKKSR